MSARPRLFQRLASVFTRLFGGGPRPDFQEHLSQALRANDHVDLNAEALGRLVERQLSGSTLTSADDSNRAS